MLKRLKPKSEFSKNVLTLMTGSMLAQAIPIAISPILTRIYTPEDFGLLALYMSIASIFATFATGKYELAIMLPKKEEDAVNMLLLSIIIAFIVSMLSLAVIFVLNHEIVSLLGDPALSSWLYVIPLSVLLTGLYQSFNFWNNRKKRYRRLAVSRVSQSATTGATNLGLGLGGFGAGGLIIGGLLGQAVSTSVLGQLIWKNDKKMFPYVNRLKLVTLMKKYQKFPFLSLPNALIDSFRLSGINLLIAKYFETATLGQFSLAWKMVQVPIVLIGGALGQVFFQKVASSKKSELYDIIIKYIAKASLVAAPIFLFVYLFAEKIFGFVFGENWILAGEAASVMAPWLFINFVSSPLVSVMLVLNRQEVMLIFSIFYAVVPLGLIVIFYQLGFIVMLQIVTAAMSMMLLVVSIFIIYLARKEQMGHCGHF